MTKQLLNLAFVRCEKLCRSWRMLSTKADPNDILLDLRNSSHPTQRLSKTAD